MTERQYLTSSFPDGDREFVDGFLVERNVGTPGHSRLQKVLIAHLSQYEKKLGIGVFPACRTRVGEARYRVPDMLVMLKPFRQNDRVILDPPLLVVEILSSDDSMKHVLQRLRDYQEAGVCHIILLVPEDKAAFSYAGGVLVQRDLSVFDIPGRGLLPFDSRELFARLDPERSGQ